MNELETAIIDNVLYKYYEKHKKLPSFGHCLVATNVIQKGDMLDYMLDKKNGTVYVKYSYYKNANEENKYIMASLKLCKE